MTDGAGGNDVSLWGVFRWLGDGEYPHCHYDQVRPRRHGVGDSGAWEAEDAGRAFRAAVLDNEWENTRTGSYLVLPWTGGATFDVAINLEARTHDEAKS